MQAARLIGPTRNLVPYGGVGVAAPEGIGAPALLTPARRAGNRSQAKGGRAGCVPKLAGMLGMDLEHNFLGSTGAQERPWQRPRRSMGGHRGLQGHFGRQGGVRFLKVKPKPNVIFFKVGVRGGGSHTFYDVSCT